MGRRRIWSMSITPPSLRMIMSGTLMPLSRMPLLVKSAVWTI